MIDGDLAQVRLTVGAFTHPVVISPVSECITGTDILSNWQNPHILPECSQFSRQHCTPLTYKTVFNNTPLKKTIFKGQMNFDLLENCSTITI